MRGDEASIVTEYASLVALAALLMVVVPATPVRDHVVGLIQAAVCRIAPAACVAGPAALLDEDFAPARCTVTERAFQGEVAVTVALFDTSSGLGFARSERSDSTTAFTLVDRASVGVGAGTGGEVAGGTSAIAVGVTARAALAAEQGDTWIVPTETADEVQRRLVAGEVIDRIAARLGVGSGIAGWAADRALGVLGEPDLTFVAAGLDGVLEARAGSRFWEERLAGLDLGLSASARTGRLLDHSAADPAEWTVTDYFEVATEMTAALGLPAGTVPGGQDTTSTLRATRNTAGDLLSIEVVTRTAGSAAALADTLAARLPDTLVDTLPDTLADTLPDTLVDTLPETLPDATTELDPKREIDDDTPTVVETTTLDLGSPPERQLAEQWLASLGTRAATPLRDLAQQRGRVSVVVYHGADENLALGARGGVGAQLGGRGSVGGSRSAAAAAYYLGAPDPSGRRQFVPFAACVDPAGG